MQLGKYQLINKLATGGMAEVYLARCAGPMGFEKTLVLKCILPHLAEDPQFVEMFLSEARLAAQLDHPNVVQIFDFGETEGTWYLAMEYIDGLNLRVLSRRAQAAGLPLPPASCARIIAWACEGLAFAHERTDPATGEPLGLIHRDVSPDNILLSRQGAVKVVDFGIAKAAGQGHRTQTGVVKGKLAYMPPEQLRGIPLDRRVDVYALGVVLYELLTGTRPFDATSEAHIIQSILHEPFVPAVERRPDLPPVLQHILERTLAREREQRYPDCRAMQSELEHFLLSAGAPVGAWQLAQLVAQVTDASQAPTAAEPRGTPREGLARRQKTPPPLKTHSLVEPPRTAPITTPAARPIRVEVPATREFARPASPPRVEGLEVKPRLRPRLLAAGVGAGMLLLVGAGAGAFLRGLTPAEPQPAVHEPASDPSADRTETIPPPDPEPRKEEAGQTPPSGDGKETQQMAEATPLPKREPGPEHPENKNPPPVHPARSPKRYGPRTPKSVPPPEASQGQVKTGTVEFRINPFATVELDGKNIGQTPFEEKDKLHEISAGKHRVKLVNPALGKEFTAQFEVHAGEAYIFKHNFLASDEAPSQTSSQ